ncbi:MAG: M20/M25/M40 family metallo-hydrolase [Planctomycetes bacterium]|nr:M20/M25/M40 family metallo-hydrolase [Planctomycetota bacterium]
MSRSLCHRVAEFGGQPTQFVRNLGTALGLALAVSAARAEDPPATPNPLDRVTITDLKRHCGTLASDALEGREAGTNGGQAAAAYLQSELRKIPGITAAGSSGWVQEFGNNFRNVLAVLPGSDPELRSEIIVIGAHYDHVGRGNQTNSHGPLGYIHNGADDNASGTAALLELADAFAALKTPPRRTLLFAFWDAEEAGLLGSRHWVTHPTHPLKDVRLVVNIDMLGRLREGKLIVVGWRSAAGLRSRLVRHNPIGDLDFQYEPKVIADSDHYPFYAAGIPALHLDSGKHDDYHRPSDDVDKLNFAGIRRLAEMVFHLVHQAANADRLPNFRREALTEVAPAWLTPRPQPAPSARLGVVFDVQQFAQNRAVITQVTPGSAAIKAGLRPGDRILKIAHWDGDQVNDIRTIVQVAKNPVQVRVERPGTATPVDVTLGLAGDPVRVGVSWELDPAIPEAAILTRVVPDSPAERAGLKIGDALMQVGGEPVETDEKLRQQLLTKPNPISFKIERHGRVADIAVELFEPPSVP